MHDAASDVTLPLFDDEDKVGDNHSTAHLIEINRPLPGEHSLSRPSLTSVFRTEDKDLDDDDLELRFD